MHVLDIGSGIGVPARYAASRPGRRVSGIDLAGEFINIAKTSTGALLLGAAAPQHAIALTPREFVVSVLV